MGIINVLDFQVANLIAAGEVVDRPASVVKELMENSIDAGATDITVEIQRGGISFIRVSDNGKGMSKDDAQLCLKRHATSKIRYASDLDGIMTLGFRGEAMAAIASVSKMRIMTKQKDSSIGTLVCCEAGEIKEVRETGCANGTTVIAEELFYNVPARRKFLKKDASEGMAIASIVEKIALSEPSVAIKFISDGSPKLTTVGNGQLLDVIYRIYGRDFAKKLIETANETEGISISGYITNPDYTRANRNFQNYYINGRYFKSKTVTAAIEQAYESYIPSDKFPGCILNITVHPAFVDVNVHPTKLEVKFSDERVVFDAVYCAIKNTLSEKLIRPELEYKQSTKLTGDYLRIAEPFLEIKENKSVPSERKSTVPLKQETQNNKETALHLEKRNESVKTDDYFSPKFSEEEILSDKDKIIKDDITVTLPKINLDFGKTSQKDFSKSAYNFPFSSVETIDSNNVNAHIKTDNTIDTINTRQAELLNIPKFKIIGEAFDSYVFVELEDKILVIDKHAAHERIIFEEMKRNLKKSGSFSQNLLIPLKIKLSNEEYSSAEDHREEIEKNCFGFSLNKAEMCAEINSIPSGIDNETAIDIFEGIVGKISDSTGTATKETESVFEKALYQASCKAAIKAGKQYASEHITWICEKLLSLPDIKFCPHGRPVAFEMSKHDFEHRFKRS